ncbi:FecCD family ABC transporter permease [Salipiger mangrovisoli]|uniref:Iron ABC transporter permease n=1 Tax=Salipiger mangrovisoli TaxID=2865933 RepID=A0ABR9XB25_9RHOB|nr:iron ABC transporter permease [Salipiger mangrovisoli]MBE9640713.1 iron ABC transporter permease [Salipiger mangrovisoli]
MVAIHPEGHLVGDRRGLARRTSWVLAALLLVAAYASLAVGASGVSLPAALADLLAGREIDARARIILLDIRLPRLLTGMMVGASLAVAGAVLQGLFRNPLADPGLVGVSAGAGLGAISAIVLGGLLPGGLAGLLGSALMPVLAFAGSWLSVSLLYVIATRGGHTSVATMLLGGIALAAMTAAFSGLLIYMADDQQLRDLTFWSLGSLAGASWSKTLAAAPLMLAALLTAPALSRGLNALALGEAAAHHLGIPVQRLKTGAIVVVAAAVGAATAISGGIGFVGIVVPHLLRLATGPDHRALLVNSGVLGASLLLLADVVSRSIVAPSELPIGIVTAVIGGPFFLWILLRRRGSLEI